jgi:hypothetical protein
MAPISRSSLMSFEFAFGARAEGGNHSLIIWIIVARHGACRHSRQRIFLPQGYVAVRARVLNNFVAFMLLPEAIR